MISTRCLSSRCAFAPSVIVVHEQVVQPSVQASMHSQSGMAFVDSPDSSVCTGKSFGSGLLP